jgi:hypothetical protein
MSARLALEPLHAPFSRSPRGLNGSAVARECSPHVSALPVSGSGNDAPLTRRSADLMPHPASALKTVTEVQCDAEVLTNTGVWWRGVGAATLWASLSGRRGYIDSLDLKLQRSRSSCVPLGQRRRDLALL